MKFWILVWSFFCLKTTACLIVNAARERMKTNMKQIWKKSNWEIQLSENPKLVAELSQIGGGTFPNWWRNFPKLVVDRKAALQPHPVHLCEVGQWESARSRVEKANSVRSCPLSMKIFAAICHERKIPRSQGIRSPDPLPQVGRGTWLAVLGSARQVQALQ